jgi:hypothetical protein
VITGVEWRGEREIEKCLVLGDGKHVFGGREEIEGANVDGEIW